VSHNLAQSLNLSLRQRAMVGPGEKPQQLARAGKRLLSERDRPQSKLEGECFKRVVLEDLGD
jgi:hypothetical protein